MNIGIPSSDRPAADGPPPGRQSRRRRSVLFSVVVVVGLVGLVISWASRDVADDVEAASVAAPGQVVSRWELVGSLPAGADIARIAGDRIVAFGRTDESMNMWLLADDGGWVAIDLPDRTRFVDVAGEGDAVGVAAVADDVNLTLIDPVRGRRPWVGLEGDRVVSLRLVAGTLDAVVEKTARFVEVTMPAGWASPDLSEWDITPVVGPHPRRPVFLEYFDHGLIIGTEQIDDESPPGRVIVSPDNGTTWVEFDLGGVSDFGSVGGVPVVIGSDGVVYRVESGPPVGLVATDAGDLFEHPPWPWAGGLADRVDPTSPVYVYLPTLDADLLTIRWDESGVSGQVRAVSREGLAITIDDDSGERLIYRWRGSSALP